MLGRVEGRSFNVPNGRYGLAIKTFLYLHTDDLDAARRFYSELIGLDEIYFSVEDGSVGYQVGTLQLAVSHHPHAEFVPDWSNQLGWQGGTSSMPSFGVELPTASFRSAVRAMQAAGVAAWTSEPQWVGYWSYPVRDPAGHTVEVSATDEDAWPE